MECFLLLREEICNIVFATLFCFITYFVRWCCVEEGYSCHHIVELRGGEYLLDGYITGENGSICIDGVQCDIQYYQQAHSGEYLVSAPNGKKRLYKHGLLKEEWIGEYPGGDGDFTVYEKGVVQFIQRWDNLLNGDEWIRVMNSKNGILMEVTNCGTEKVVYRGGFSANYKRNGRGIQYDVNTGRELLEGVFKNDRLVRICKIFEGNEMMEFVDNGNNVDVVNQIPIYVGGYIVDENDGLFKRNGLGYLIDVDKRIAVRECIYENGVELNGIDLIDGRYNKKCKHPVQIQNYPASISIFEQESVTLQPDVHVVIHKSKQLNEMSMEVTSLVVGSNSCNELKELNLNEYKWLKSIEIKNYCFQNVNIFRIDGLKHLKSLKIGKNAFTLVRTGDNMVKANNKSRSFSILNCDELKSIEIGEFSFSDYAGGFELRNLPKLTAIKIGEINSWSGNFFYSIFKIKGNIDMILLMNRSSEFIFYYIRRYFILLLLINRNIEYLNELTNLIIDLPNLNSINLGGYALYGNEDDESCSLTMESDII